MRYKPLNHHRRSIRLHAYDYARKGSYFITICTRRECLFGEITNGELTLSQIGEMVQRCWLDLPNHFPNVTLDKYQTMPNHVHGIVVLWADRGRDLIPPNRRRTGNQIPAGIWDENFKGNPNVFPGRDVQLNVPTVDSRTRLSPLKGSLSVIVRTFKAAVTTWARRNGHEYFGWQPRFHDHIIRDKEDLERIRAYIRENPANWMTDEENPQSNRKTNV